MQPPLNATHQALSTSIVLCPHFCEVVGVEYYSATIPYSMSGTIIIDKEDCNFFLTHVNPWTMSLLSTRVDDHWIVNEQASMSSI